MNRAMARAARAMATATKRAMPMATNKAMAMVAREGDGGKRDGDSDWGGGQQRGRWQGR
jgi:hypothetical protein